jgi:hypothetical protein
MNVMNVIIICIFTLVFVLYYSFWKERKKEDLIPFRMYNLHISIIPSPPTPALWSVQVLSRGYKQATLLAIGLCPREKVPYGQERVFPCDK